MSVAIVDKFKVSKSSQITVNIFYVFYVYFNPFKLGNIPRKSLLFTGYLFNCLIDVDAVSEVSLQGYYRPNGRESVALQRVYTR